MTNNNTPPRPRRANRRDGYLSKILFWEQELTAHTFGRSRYPLSRIEESLAYFKERRAAYLRSLETVDEGKLLFERLCDQCREQGDDSLNPENVHCDGEDLASEDIAKPKLSAGTMGALAEFAKKHGYQIPE